LFRSHLEVGELHELRAQGQLVYLIAQAQLGPPILKLQGLDQLLVTALTGIVAAMREHKPYHIQPRSVERGWCQQQLVVGEG
jgi:hypothetical protein